MTVTAEYLSMRQRAEREIMSLEPCEFEYIDVNASELLQLIAVGSNGWVGVIGHPSDASYEWVARQSDDFDGDQRVVLRHSNVGYGSSVAALRDGLVANVD